MNSKLINQYKKLHERSPSYGSGATYVKKIHEICKLGGYNTALDFGCGKGKLADSLNELGIKTRKYDPAIPEYSATPNTKYDLVIANDVLEHLDPFDFMHDMRFMFSFVGKGVFLNISCRPAIHRLPNGTNCHTLVMSPDKWLTLLTSFKNLTLIGSNYHEDNENLEVSLIANNKYYCYTCRKNMLYYSDHSVWMCPECERISPL